MLHLAVAIMFVMLINGVFVVAGVPRRTVFAELPG